ncbi:MAG TPA: bifunctional DNA-formamidopyrimidine glycosylase/DNA-(apurinic or apyrimidinic site) lyase [Microthrixaceae bacterium]|jgi:formamidopyrimidine-DNA glycosylase|nr:bifunctional DNA-formamidopyrimidine glycosylase/DNA-(apurinic or apyrimidinic site) lyase [Microthrixaceae bacterium]
MPELPEVETIRRQLEPSLVGASIVESWAFPSAKFDDAPAAVGTTVERVSRRGKYLLIALERDDMFDAELVVHLGMTGRVAVTPPLIDGAPPTHPHLRAWWALDDGRVLTFHDARRFGRIAVVAPGDYGTMPTLAALGPEPTDPEFTAETLRLSINGGRRRVKTALLSQRPVAGVGNIYADEALWRSGIDPRSRRLTRAGAARLRDAIQDVLQEGIDHGGTTLRDYVDADGVAGTNQHHLDCYGRAGAPCNRCGTTMKGVVLDGRSTTWCPNCQR